ncbi:MAG: SRPBCC family protein [Acidobacteriia bacterium]|nr:SRPBCC family protein [Terriglobia bacterium]
MTFQTPAPIEQVWALLSDPRRVVTCVPGAQITEQVDEKTYRGLISMKVGPTVTDYKGEVQIVRLNAQNYEMEILGKGQDVRGKGSASMKMTGKLRTLPGGLTEVASVSEVNVVGILAQMGSRVINEASNIMFERFTRNFQEKLQQESAGATGPGGAATTASTSVAKPIAGFSLAWKAFWSIIAGLFDRKPKS